MLNLVRLSNRATARIAGLLLSVLFTTLLLIFPLPVVAAPVITEYDLPTTGVAAGLRGITAGPDGNLWFAAQDSNRIGRITTAGVVTQFTVPTAGSQPLAITSGSDGNLWFTEESGNKIGRITPTGTFTEFGLPTANSLPGRITTGADGNVWFTEQTNNKIGRITPAGVITEFTRKA